VTTGHSSNSVSQYQAVRFEAADWKRRVSGSYNRRAGAAEAVNQARHRVFRWVVDKQVYVFGFAVHFDQLRLEVGTNLFEDDFEPLDGVLVKHLSSILCHEDQMDM
jgi:hypothetical protein